MKKLLITVFSLVLMLDLVACGSSPDKATVGDGPALENMTVSPAALKDGKSDLMKDVSKDNHYYNYKVNDEDTCAKVELHTYKDGKWETELIAAQQPLANIDGAIGIGFNKEEGTDKESVEVGFIVNDNKKAKISVGRSSVTIDPVDGKSGFERVWGTGNEPIVMGDPVAVMGDFSTEKGDSPNLTNYKEFKGEFAQVVTITFVDKL